MDNSEDVKSEYGSPSVSNLVKHIRLITSERDKALKDASNAHKKLKDMQEQFLNTDQENGILQRKITFLNSELESLQSELDYKKRSFKNLKECADILHNENDSNNQKLQILDKKLEQTESDLNLIKIQLDKANQRLEERNITLRALRSRLKSEEQRYTDEHLKLTNEMQKSSKFESTSKEFESRVAFLEQEISRIDGERNDTEKELKRYNDLIYEMQTQNASSDAANQRLGQQKDQLEMTLEEITKKFASADGELEQARRTIKVKDLKIEELTSQLSKESIRRSLLQENLERLVECSHDNTTVR